MSTLPRKKKGVIMRSALNNSILLRYNLGNAWRWRPRVLSNSTNPYFLVGQSIGFKALYLI